LLLGSLREESFGTPWDETEDMPTIGVPQTLAVNMLYRLEADRRGCEIESVPRKENPPTVAAGPPRPRKRGRKELRGRLPTCLPQE
jgi:hypothetical protein